VAGPAAPRLDPRAPLVLDTRQRPRRPGTQRLVHVDAPAPGDLGTPMLGVPVGAPLSIDVRLEAVVEGVLVTAHVDAPLAGECGRCLDPVVSAIGVDVQELYAYPDREVPADDDAELPVLVGDLLDLEPLLRDAIVLALPLTPLCTPDCAGLCPGCGERLDDLPAEHAHGDAVDPRWAALRSL